MAFDRRTLILHHTQSRLVVPAGFTARPAATLFLVDASGSMGGFGQAPADAARSYIKELKESCNADIIAAGIATFANAIVPVIPLQPVRDIDLSTFVYTAMGGTFLNGTMAAVLPGLIELHQHVLDQTQNRVDLSVVLGLVTDGDDTTSPAEAIHEVRRLAPEAMRRKFSLKIYGLGVDAASIAHNMGFVNSEGKVHAETQNLRHDNVEDLRHSAVHTARAAHRSTIINIPIVDPDSQP